MYIKSSISVELTVVSIRIPFVFANGKADKTFNMFKLASISIIYPICSYLLHARVGRRRRRGWVDRVFVTVKDTRYLIVGFLLKYVEIVDRSV